MEETLSPPSSHSQSQLSLGNEKHCAAAMQPLDTDSTQHLLLIESCVHKKKKE